MARRPYLADARGFTLVELLVVMLILGILAMIALPAFLSQRAKGEDTEAQTTVRTAMTALLTHHGDHDTFDATRAQLERIEPALGEATPGLAVSGTRDTFEITEASASGTTFTVARAASGAVTRDCAPRGAGLCPGDGDW